jgi:hypothetical protein
MLKFEYVKEFKRLIFFTTAQNRDFFNHVLNCFVK